MYKWPSDDVALGAAALQGIASIARGRARSRPRSGSTPASMRRRLNTPLMDNVPLPSNQISNSVVTRQKDFTSTATTRKRRTKRQKAKFRMKKRRWIKYKRKVRKALSPGMFKIKNVYSIGRSWVSAANQQASALIPICSYRGVQSSSSSIGVAGAAGPTSYLFRADDANMIFSLYDNQTTTAGLASNATLANYWFKITKAFVDVSMTNTGSSTDANSDNAIEYEVYLLWPKKMMKDESVPMNDVGNWITQARIYQQPTLGAQTIGLGVSELDPAWKTWTTSGVPTYVRSKLLGRGYLGLNETVRFTKKMRCRFYTSRKRWNDLSDGLANSNMPLLRGLTSYIMVVWRGTPRAGAVSGGYTRSRLTFNVNKEINSHTKGGLQPGAIDTQTVSNSFA